MRRITQLSLLFALAGLAACAGEDVWVEGEPGTEAVEASADVTTQTQAIAVHTSFVVEGLDELPDGIIIDSLYLNVGGIYLEPLTDEESGITLANREPFPLRFSLDEGEVLAGPDMLLPFGGDFAVSVQLEPRYQGESRPTVELEGVVTRMVPIDTEDTESEPMPLPWREAEPMPLPWREAEPMPLPWRQAEPMPLPWDQGDDKLNARTVDVPFTYRSTQLVRFTVDDVSFDEEGDYDLVLAVRVADWITETVIPAVTHEDDDRTVADRESVEGVVLVEDRVGLEGLVGDIDASTAESGAPR